MATRGVATVMMRSYLSSHHLWAARHFTRLAKEIEDGHSGRPEFNITHRAFVVNAILSAVGFLEGAINELFDDVADEHPSYIDPLPEECCRLLIGFWNGHTGRSVEQWPVLDKYRVALLCAGKAAFEKGRQPYQDAKMLIDLRNKLTHSRPETQSSDEDKLDKFQIGMSAKFESNRLMKNAANPYFPDHCLGAGCANWAVNTVSTFADEFFDRLNITPNYQQLAGAHGKGL
jgi:hypothetical protein